MYIIQAKQFSPQDVKLEDNESNKLQYVMSFSLQGSEFYFCIV